MSAKGVLEAAEAGLWHLACYDFGQPPVSIDDVNGLASLSEADQAAIRCRTGPAKASANALRKQVWLELHGEVRAFANAVMAKPISLWALFGLTRDDLETEAGIVRLGLHHTVLRGWLKKTYRSKAEPHVRKVLTEGYGTLLELHSRDLYFVHTAMANFDDDQIAFWAAFWRKYRPSSRSVVSASRKAPLTAGARATEVATTKAAANAGSAANDSPAASDLSADVIAAGRAGIQLSGTELSAVPSHVRAEYYELMFSVGSHTTGGDATARTVGEQKYGASKPSTSKPGTSGAPGKVDEPENGEQASAHASMVLKPGQATYDPARSNGLNAGKATKIFAVTRDASAANSYRRGTSFMQAVNKSRLKANAQRTAVGRTLPRFAPGGSAAPGGAAPAASSRPPISRLPPSAKTTASASASRKARLAAARNAMLAKRKRKRPSAAPTSAVSAASTHPSPTKETAEQRAARKRQRVLARLADSETNVDARFKVKIKSDRDRQRDALFSGWKQLQERY
ncbi:uncharacterized protein AMSG_02729 [Thecamonas trahens ATCC 50062]|uniref:Uncharacterized protein n=1 Tax=Thecamonas trahens ATCC 50062 TaxID=461836 RepID=A0A0L0D244_THETB|nr:hypothetical protein AMSG_02729 [Thecamonas trahens ATCC 50062]KNC46276.1 hypothetical protein AMSG_02729 [Thecamonas trahens ATCC 50062]|eukprot:XP_013760570.1 hypothetical protein AMSG_02729 [Thecamonas trahens ATCC 50062]